MATLLTAAPSYRRRYLNAGPSSPAQAHLGVGLEQSARERRWRNGPEPLAPVRQRRPARTRTYNPRTMPIYLDHAATTPLRPEVLEAMLPFLGGT
ncbi:MAG: hypothetical protein Q8M74_04160, partial [Chloroflexota bacterium]|nr:hypothetical protein [Chloroflexota bacterium]